MLWPHHLFVWFLLYSGEYHKGRRRWDETWEFLFLSKKDFTKFVSECLSKEPSQANKMIGGQITDDYHEQKILVTQLL